MKPTLLAVVALAACGAPAHPSAPLRLDGRVRPLGYALSLTIDPAQESFSGVAEIRLALPAATRSVWLHGVELRELRARLGDQPARATQAGEMLRFDWDRAVGPGEATLVVEYQASATTRELDGVLRRRHGDQWYVFTQFEDTLARRAFPCFDEPPYKVPLTLTLRVPRGQIAVANAPVARTDEDGAWTRVRFAEMPPLPTYLWAFAVGPFDVVEGGGGLRIIMPRGRASEAAYAARESRKLFDRLVTFFGVPYPYAKLDQIAVPGFAGAMENAGLITYADDILLARPEDITPRWERRWGTIVAHEMAHHWFGDLVTPAWWDELWLAESFATWMEEEIAGDWRSDLGIDALAVETREEAMSLDALASTRRIREPIRGADDIANAFDAITYEKGSSVLRMIDGWVGRESMRKALRRFFERHAHGLATTSDFVAALDAASGLDVGPVLASFLDQPGTPLVTTTLVCDGRPRLRLRQERMLPLGSRASRAERWKIPVCVRHDAGRTCGLLDGETSELALPVCPRHYSANDGGKGYYRVHYTEPLSLDFWLAADPAELVGLVADQRALADAGKVALGDVLALAGPLVRAKPNAAVSRRHLFTAAVQAAALDDEIVPRDLQPNRTRFLARLFLEEAERLGWRPRRGETADDRLLRPIVLGVAAGLPGPLADEGRRLALAWLDDPRALDGDLVEIGLSRVARAGDPADFDRLAKAAHRLPTTTDRVRVLRALGSYSDPALLGRALVMSLDPALEPREAFRIVTQALENAATREAAHRFVRQHLGELEARLPRNFGTLVVEAHGHFCDERWRREVSAFFGPRAGAWLGARRALTQTEEQIELCAARAAKLGPAAAAFLRDQ